MAPDLGFWPFAGHFWRDVAWHDIDLHEAWIRQERVAKMSQELMNTREVAAYLRIKERKVYDLVARRKIPCTRATGKWLFQKSLIDLWLLEHSEGGAKVLPDRNPPAIVAGSHDPLLEWAVRESESGLAVLFDGSLDGLERLSRGEASACGMHVLETHSGEYNTPVIQRRALAAPVVAIEWAVREQGIMVAPSNPRRIHTVEDLVGVRFAARQKEAGSHVLLEHLLGERSLRLDDLCMASPPARSESEVALAVAEGTADAGLGIAAVARQMRLDFVPVWRERYDLVVWRRQYFEPGMQNLVCFTRSEAFAGRAAGLAGYDVSGTGTVRYNAP